MRKINQLWYRLALLGVICSLVLPPTPVRGAPDSPEVFQKKVGDVELRGTFESDAEGDWFDAELSSPAINVPFELSEERISFPEFAVNISRFEASMRRAPSTPLSSVFQYLEEALDDPSSMDPTRIVLSTVEKILRGALLRSLETPEGEPMSVAEAAIVLGTEPIQKPTAAKEDSGLRGWASRFQSGMNMMPNTLFMANDDEPDVALATKMSPEVKTCGIVLLVYLFLFSSYMTWYRHNQRQDNPGEPEPEGEWGSYPGDPKWSMALMIAVPIACVAFMRWQS